METKQFHYSDRKQYLQAQVARSRQKFGYCKVYFKDVLRYRELILLDRQRRGLDESSSSPILCLGVRSGVEVDIFRSVFLGPLMKVKQIQKSIVRGDQTKYAADKLRLAHSVAWGAGKTTDGRVWGVELNPDVIRQDVKVTSFDELPVDWSGRFNLIFSNSFDHSQDPHKTINEWRRVAAPGAYLIIAFPLENKPTQTDPLGQLSLEIVREYVKAEMVFASETLNRTRYHEICSRLQG
jgi:SAM-dependent methyltransferase